MLSQGQRDPTWASPAVEIRRNKLLDEIGFSEPVILVRVLRTDTTHDLSQFGNRNVLSPVQNVDRPVLLATRAFQLKRSGRREVFRQRSGLAGHSSMKRQMTRTRECQVQSVMKSANCNNSGTRTHSASRGRTGSCPVEPCGSLCKPAKRLPPVLPNLRSHRTALPSYSQHRFNRQLQRIRTLL